MKTAALTCKCEDDDLAACSVCRARNVPCICHDAERRAELIAWAERGAKRREKQLAKIRKAMEAVAAAGGVPPDVIGPLQARLLASYRTFSCPGLERASKDWARIGKLAAAGKVDEVRAALLEDLK